MGFHTKQNLWHGSVAIAQAVNEVGGQQRSLKDVKKMV